MRHQNGVKDALSDGGVAGQGMPQLTRPSLQICRSAARSARAEGLLCAEVPGLTRPPLSDEGVAPSRRTVLMPRQAR